jgi:DNA polymerase III epsilon subunit-like protein
MAEQPMTNPKEVFISVDIETAGPFPGRYSILAIGACLVEDPDISFYVELQPVQDEFVPEAVAISQLSLHDLKERGLPSEKAMREFERWIEDQVSEGEKPVFVAFNAPFDWMFICDYFHRHLNRNPFGHTALDMKAFYMGLRNSDWSETSMRLVSMQYGALEGLSHNALQDARDQARIFQEMRLEAASSRGQKGTKW